ncbi:IPTL-CTERM sorting domain-containing protein [Diaphorobacter sp. HDW4A]|uniref:IPTL-CTERM sorting domain-containing protein n=1 Tax=Diaphorobacter sp. HDW4A TaxID=2714924 RepID=UPI00140B3793|nr:IPTL-CTERM sorting domain-containing protein [Diaphorobacter sp. HDW4A]QIL78517.1 IPTL-CTERM sorting domain-containing protein [Diaphorobacter sp. HDW4A]
MNRELLSFKPEPTGGETVASWRVPRRVTATLACLAGMATAAPMVYAAGYTVDPAGGSFGASMDLDCGDLVVNGPFDATGASFTKIGKVIIGSGVTFTAANATLEVTVGWENSGTFSGAGSIVTASNACANTSTTFTGNTTFNALSATVAGHTLNFTSGSEQTVTGQLTLNGVTLTGQGGTAYLTLPTGGGQTIANVGVSGVDASRGQRLAPTGTNVITGAAVNWFGVPTPTTPTVTKPVPVTGPFGLALLSGLLAAAAHLSRRRSGTSRRKPD